MSELVNSLRRLLLVCGCILLFIPANGQNIHPSLDSIYPAFDPSTMNINPEPADLPALASYGSTWTTLLREGLTKFMWDHFSTYGEIRWDYSVFLLGGYIPIQGTLQEFIQDIAYKVFATPAFREALYQWAAPYYLKAFGRMSYNYQVSYQEQLLVAQLYLASFDYNQELADLHNDEQGFAWQKGKLNAFLFRRIHKGQMTKEECRYWIDRILMDIAPCMKDPLYRASYYDKVVSASGGYRYFQQYKDNNDEGYGAYWGALDAMGNELLPCQYKNLKRDSITGLWRFYKKGGCGLFDTNLRLVFFGDYKFILGMNESGLFPVCKEVYANDGTYNVKLLTGFYDRSGNNVFPAVYLTSAFTMADWERNENVVYPSEEIDFKYGVEILRNEEGYGLARANGNFIIPCIYQRICEAPPYGSRKLPRYLVNKGGKQMSSNPDTDQFEDGKWALFDFDGKNLSGFIYDKLELSEDGLSIHYSRGKKTGILEL